MHLGDRDPDISWAHAIELDDPAPFLRGGELVLTTGLRLPRAAAGQAAYVDRLVEAGAAALGLGTGLRHVRVPAGVRRACEAAGLPLVEVPLATPFIAVSQAVADRLGELRRLRLVETMDQQRALSRAAVRGGVEAVVRTLARQLGAGVYVCDRTWRELARAGAAQALPERLEALLGSGRRGAVSEATPAGWTEVQPVGERPLARLGWLALGRPHPLSVPERLVLTHAVSLVLLLLDRPEAAVPEAEADLVRLLLDGTGDAPAASGFGAGRAVSVLVASGPRHRLLSAVAEARRSSPHAVRAEVTDRRPGCSSSTPRSSGSWGPCSSPSGPTGGSASEQRSRWPRRPRRWRPLDARATRRTRGRLVGPPTCRSRHSWPSQRSAMPSSPARPGCSRRWTAVT